MFFIFLRVAGLFGGSFVAISFAAKTTEDKSIKFDGTTILVD